MTEPTLQDRRALLAARLRDQQTAPTHPLSYPQQRLWFLDQLQPTGAVYNVPLGYDITGPLDAAALSAALDAVVARHQVLRAAYQVRGGVPRQVVLPAGPVPMPVHDLTGEPDPAGAAGRLAAEEAGRPFDLATGPVLRASLLRLAPDRHRLLLTIHHIACDGPSVAVLAAELSAHYAGQAMPDLPAQYGDFARWQRSRLGDGAIDRLVGYWARTLDGIESLPALPTDRTRPPVASYLGASLEFPVPAPGLDALARRARTTRFAVLLAAFAVMLGRHTGGTEVVVGTPVANRDRYELAPLVGFFSNTLVLRLDLRAVTFADLVVEVGATVRDALAHADLPFELLVERLQPERDLARNPLFGVLFSYQDEPGGWSLPDCQVRPRPGDSGTAKFDLTVTLTGGADGLRGRLEYATDLYEPATAQRLAARYATVLAAALDEPDAPLARLPVVPDAELSTLLRQGAGAPVGSLVPLPRQIEAQAAATPDRPAVTSGGQTLSYQELDRAAGALAARLRAAGVGRGDRVGVLLDRSAQLVVALLAVWKAGAAYVPLDPAYPAQRLALVAADAAVPVVVSGGRLLRQAETLAPRVVDVSSTSDVAELVAPGLDDPAYVIYTSGSTGRPKGVVVNHRNLATFGAGMAGTLAGDPGTWLAVTSAGFDISILELLWPLAHGGQVVVRTAEPVGTAAAPARPVEFSLFYFGSEPDGYRLLREGARFADRHGLTAVWTPERHFHRFGGLYPNPSVTAAALASITERVRLRAGSVVLPLHDPLRVAEEWAVVDQLSGGRVGVSFASGWHANDFALAPDRYRDRKQAMREGIEEVRRLWRGGTVSRRSGTGEPVELASYPRPVQPELPVWLTSARHPDTFQLAGELGMGLLTHLVGHGPAELADKIALYRRAWREAGHPGDGHVTVMAHAFVGPDPDRVRAAVRAPLSDYLRTSLDLLASLSGAGDLRSLPAEELDAVVDRAFDRFYATTGLLGTPEQAAATVLRLAGIGVDEIACLVDFGVPTDEALAALPHLLEVRELVNRRQEEPIAEQLRRHAVTHLQCTPTLARLLTAEDGTTRALAGLRRLLVGGEALPAELARRLGSTVQGEVRNMYGPTEATIWATSHVVGGDGDVRIGTPLPGARAYVVDSRLRLVPAGVPGELVIGGDYVAAGYLGRPGMTADRFVPDPFAEVPGARLYRTGDLVRWRDGAIEFLGRLDDQVKVRGYRVELGEVEAALASHPGVRAAAVAVRGDRLVGYYLPEPGADPPDPMALRARLAAVLPEPMVPATYLPLSEFPRTPNGKLDRRALPEVGTAVTGSDAAPGTDLERVIAGVWCEVLGVEQVGPTDNFFEIGGNSMLVVQVRMKLRDTVAGELSLVDMFRYPTVGALAAAVANRAGQPPAADPTRAAARRRAATVHAGVVRQRTRR